MLFLGFVYVIYSNDPGTTKSECRHFGAQHHMGFGQVIQRENYAVSTLSSIHQLVFSQDISRQIHLHNVFLRDDKHFRYLSAMISKWTRWGVDAVSLTQFVCAFAVRLATMRYSRHWTPLRVLKLCQFAVPMAWYSLGSGCWLSFSNTSRFRLKAFMAVHGKKNMDNIRDMVMTDIRSVLSRCDARALFSCSTYISTITALSRLRGYKALDSDDSFMSNNLCNVLHWLFWRHSLH